MKSLGLVAFNPSHLRRSIIAGLNTGAFTCRRLVGFTTLALAAGPLRITRAEESSAPDVNLDNVKAYVVDQAAEMKKGTAPLRAIADRYYDLAKSAGFDY